MDPRRARFLSALSGAPVDRPPVWLMRQAGRYLPGYRAVKAEHGFWDICRNPELSTRVALEPLNLFQLDAAIVFSDILVVPQALGIGVTFGGDDGPKLATPLRSADDLRTWKTDGITGRLAFVSEAVRHLARTLNGSHGLIGFAGAPFTLFAYCVEGSSSDDFLQARAFLRREPAVARQALTILADVIAEYLEAQCAAGADVVQLFDSWGGLLDRETYTAFAVPAIRRITDALRAKSRKTLVFIRGGQHLLPVLDETGADGFSLDWRIGWKDARAALGEGPILQGQLDPALLLSDEASVRAAVSALVTEMKASHGGRKSILNLGHGISKDSSPALVKALCDELARHG